MQSKFCFLTRKEINTELWNDKVKTLRGGKIYWQDWYLDAVTDGKWDAVVAKDYRWIWPLPYNRKLFGFKQVYQPVLSQQLGPLGKMDGEVYHQVLRKLKRKYLRFNQQGPFLSVDIAGMHPRTNMELDLSGPYTEIFKGYGRGLKQNIRRTESMNLSVRNSSDLDGLMQLTEKQLGKKANLKPIDIQRIRQLLKTGLENKAGAIYEVYSPENELLNSSYFFKDHRSIYNIYGASTDLGPKYYAMPFLLDFLIKKHAETPMTLDFEGSDIPGVAKFFRSFGPRKYLYYQLKFGRF